MIVLAFDRDWTVNLSPHPTFERIFTVLVPNYRILYCSQDTD